MNDFEKTIELRKATLLDAIREPLAHVANQLQKVWHSPAQLNEELAQHIGSANSVKRCHQIYVFDANGTVISEIFSKKGVVDKNAVDDISSRPYFSEALPTAGMHLSRTYTNQTTQQNCVTAVQTVRDNSQVLGYLAADFILDDIGAATTAAATKDRREWVQMKGDPSIRGTLFMQSRTQSVMDETLDDVNSIIEELILKRGVFHAKLHYSSSRATIWLYDDPYHYRVHNIQEILNDVLLAYPKRDYPKEANVPPDVIVKVFAAFRELRDVDETIYLRAGSLNIINGMIGLNFSCDGSHYIPYEEFLDKGQSFWIGAAGSTATESESES
ncbi:MAG: Unknown protein [uncultured Thiotrichaceae bacterium]|uniref:Cache domain-containing protein n=1 Tax=uncultured Thiotrichaceae bacterium TaxID=298394 RepID=A0A6S6TJW1_9GAMM|nr:MAG: Unknown protein [uncultured Thiotrichaceae bacterium]